ncbi:carboxylesterase family protein [Sphingomonas piscis]|uniref:Carboxylic ester hydrolase n=1 Tax=Sphingomonas piscis TaxID=2714943 RepID=A0A6G7YMA8_9SPHN|nr:carboxylesterase family protein [Sphingomonas piscis]QIK77872.1 carboxylesterase family protein [Sphingomonas piscis]
MLKFGMSAALLMIALSGTASAAGPIARTESGQVSGSVGEGVKSWKGIPFAAPPVGENRWRAPQPAAKWAGVRQATDYGHDCMQLPFPSDAAPLGTAPAEDCLVMNVWAPERAKAGAKLPVIAWIYGGGFVNGGSSPPTYSGADLAKKGVVFASFNYRLGRFGTFVHPQLTADGGMPAGNYWLMDQIAALKWIKRNIAAFGGDPSNVTIIGESAGGMSVNTLLTSPMAGGLFHRAVVMSGGDGKADPAGQAAAQAASLRFAEGKGIAAGDAQALAKLRALSGEQVVDGLNLMALFRPSNEPRNFAWPFVDGAMAVDPASAMAAGKLARVPVMIGATSNDSGGPTGYMATGAHTLAGVLSAKGVPTYAYRFSYVAESLGKTGADHASDIPFFFNTQDTKYGAATTARDNGMGEAISSYIANFARRGDPNGKGLPAWPRYSKSADVIMDFSAAGTAVAGKDPLGAQLDASAAASPRR